MITRSRGTQKVSSPPDLAVGKFPEGMASISSQVPRPFFCVFVLPISAYCLSHAFKSALIPHLPKLFSSSQAFEAQLAISICVTSSPLFLSWRAYSLRVEHLLHQVQLQLGAVAPIQQ